MTMDFDTKDANKRQNNVPEFTISELAFSVKRTVEAHYEHVRVRGEISRVSIPRSGHMYTSLKDESAVIDAVCWKGVLSRLSLRPEEGLEVICTGKMTTYPGNSRYQLVIESMELAGEGALLKMLEDRKKKLAAEGVFAKEHKKSLPFLPERIGVVTSPTGAVIRDILHRLADRFPRNVIVWPTKVQGEGADKEIARAINGLNSLNNELKPDIIIVARGGGSLEDLMPFNEEIVVRAASQSHIPIISAIGHETDTTLIDYAADKRAPTPTGAAEIAVPMRIHLQTQLLENEKRLLNAASGHIKQQKHKIETLGAKLGDPSQIIELKMQHIDRKSDRLDHALENKMNRANWLLTQTSSRLTHPKQMLKNKELAFISLSSRTLGAFTRHTANKAHSLERTTSRLRPPLDRIRTKSHNLARTNAQLDRTRKTYIKDRKKGLTHITEKLELLSFENVLARGYVVIRSKNGAVITKPENLSPDQEINLQFKENIHTRARILSDKPLPGPVKKPKKTTNDPVTGELLLRLRDH